MNTYKIIFFESDDDAEARSVLVSGFDKNEALNHFYDVYPWASVEDINLSDVSRDHGSILEK
jgi:hypothetical protein